MKLLRSYPSRWGGGKVHVRGNSLPSQFSDTVAVCSGLHIHAEPLEGSPEDVTCKRCIRLLERRAATK